MRKVFFIFSVVFVFVLFIPFDTPWTSGTYNKITGLYICESELSCLHEIGHKLDDESGWISHTNDFYEAVNLYTNEPLERGVLSKNMEEFYAELFSYSGGVSENMPELLRPFYDWDRAQELIEKVMR